MSTETLIQPAIKGYRQLSPAEAELMNEIKQKGAELGALVEKLRSFPASAPIGMTNLSEPRMVSVPFGERPSIDQRWVSIGATDLQQGLMALTRAVAQPSSF